MTDKEILMYAHAGSGNHGCEAIVRSVCGILGKENSISVLSHDIGEDQKYGLDGVCRLIQERDIDKNFLLGKTTEGRAGFVAIRVNVKIDADMTEAEKVAFLHEVEKRCPIADNMAGTTSITAHVVA